MKKNYEKPEVQTLDFKLDDSIMNTNIEGSMGAEDGIGDPNDTDF